jgi:hypothetical protein
VPKSLSLSDMESTIKKPLNGPAYGTIGHLPNSRLAPSDRCVPAGQYAICCQQARDRHDRVIIEEKLDGSATAVALLGGQLVAMNRAGYPAITSPYTQHHLFDAWCHERRDRFRQVLREGERIVGEWLAQAHGTRYDLTRMEPWGVFDILDAKGRRLPFNEFRSRVDGVFAKPTLLHDDGPLPVSAAMALHELYHWPCDQTEGLVYRVERKGRVEFLAKWVRPGKVDGKYLPAVTGGEPIWNWKP